MKIPQKLKYIGLVTTMALASFSAHSQTSGISPYIINGTQIDTADYPYMTLLYISYLDEFPAQYSPFCGGSLLDESHVLTAAHCVDSLTMGEFARFEIGVKIDDASTDLGDTNKRYPVEAVYYPDDYYKNENEGKIANDIAILKLARSVDTSLVSSYANINLSGEPYKTAIEPFTVIGYGLTHPDNNNMSTTLNKAQVYYFSDEKICAAWGGSDSKICTTSSAVAQQSYMSSQSPEYLRSGTCQGDSGGPLLYDHNGTTYQVGVTSYGPTRCGNANDAIEGVYTKISAYDNSGWIANVLNETEKPKYDRQGDYRDNGSDNETNESSSGGSSSGGSSGGGATSLWLLLGLALLAWRRKMDEVK